MPMHFQHKLQPLTMKLLFYKLSCGADDEEVRNLHTDQSSKKYRLPWEENIFSGESGPAI